MLRIEINHELKTMCGDKTVLELRSWAVARVKKMNVFMLKKEQREGYSFKWNGHFSFPYLI